MPPLSWLIHVHSHYHMVHSAPTWLCTAFPFYLYLDSYTTRPQPYGTLHPHMVVHSLFLYLWLLDMSWLPSMTHSTPIYTIGSLLYFFSVQWSDPSCPRWKPWRLAHRVRVVGSCRRRRGYKAEQDLEIQRWWGYEVKQAILGSGSGGVRWLLQLWNANHLNHCDVVTMIGGRQ